MYAKCVVHHWAASSVKISSLSSISLSLVCLIIAVKVDLLTSTTLGIHVLSSRSPCFSECRFGGGWRYKEDGADSRNMSFSRSWRGILDSRVRAVSQGNGFFPQELRETVSRGQEGRVLLSRDVCPELWSTRASQKWPEVGVHVKGRGLGRRPWRKAWFPSNSYFQLRCLF